MASFRIDPDSSWAWVDMRTNLHGAHVETNGLEGSIDAVLAGGRFDLTFHGVTRRVRGELRLLAGDDGGFELEGEQVFDIRDFGIDPPRLLMLKADPEVRVRVRLVARRAASS
jgi:hypothetical protein